MVPMLHFLERHTPKSGDGKNRNSRAPSSGRPVGISYIELAAANVDGLPGECIERTPSAFAAYLGVSCLKDQAPLLQLFERLGQGGMRHATPLLHRRGCG